MHTKKIKATTGLILLALTSPMLWANQDLLQAGPMIGYMDIVETVIWVQTKSSAKVTVSYWAGDEKPVQSAPIVTSEQDLYIARFVISGLVENTRYQYAVAINGKELKFPYPLTFKTQKHWQYRTDPPDVRFALGSCLYINDPPYDRPGTPYGGDFEILQALAAEKPDFMLWLGDNTYLRESDFFSPLRLEYRYRHDRAFPQLQQLLATAANYATWDDHDYGPNNSNRSYAFKDVTLALFKAYWANPSYGMPDTPGVFFRFSWSDLDFFVTDDRYYRAPNQSTELGKPYLGEAQMQWLKDSLLDSNASFKFVVIGNQVLNIHSRHESYPSYQEEWSALMQWLNSNDVSGVVFLTGDRHHTELIKWDRVGNYPLYDFTSSPLTSGWGGPLESEENNPLRVPGTLTHGKRNYGIIEVAGPRNERVLTLKTCNKDGGLEWEKSIPRSELMRPVKR